MIKEKQMKNLTSQWKIKSKTNVNFLVIIALLFSLKILTAKLEIGSSIMRISPSFIPNYLIAMIAGPFWTGIIMVFGELIKLPFSSAPFIPGASLLTFISGFLHGLFFYRKPVDIKNKKHWLRTFLGMSIIIIIHSILLNNLWITLMSPNPSVESFIKLIYLRSILLLQIPIKVVLLMLIVPRVQSLKSVKKFLSEE